MRRTAIGGAVVSAVLTAMLGIAITSTPANAAPKPEPTPTATPSPEATTLGGVLGCC